MAPPFVPLSRSQHARPSRAANHQLGDAQNLLELAGEDEAAAQVKRVQYEIFVGHSDIASADVTSSHEGALGFVANAEHLLRIDDDDRSADRVKKMGEEIWGEEAYGALATVLREKNQGQ